MKTHKNSPIDKGRRAADRFIPKSVSRLSRQQLVDYGGVLYARGYEASELRAKRSAKREQDLGHG